jgi:hypothetical protein
MDEYEERVRATAALRLALLLHELKVLGDYTITEFLYPNEEQLKVAEEHLK